MKKIFKLMLVLVCIIGVNSVNALQEDYYMNSDISFPSDISSKKGTLTINEQYSNYKTYYQFQSILKENYDEILKLQKKYEEDVKTYMTNKNAKADEVVINCGFEKEAIMNWCGGAGGLNCVSLEYDKNQVSDTCKNSLSEYEEKFTYLKAIKQPDLTNYLPNIDESKWIETTNNEFVINDDLTGYQVLFAKVNGTETEGLLVNEDSTSYSFKLYDLNTYNSEMKDSATINKEQNTEVSKDIESSTTITKPVENVKEEINNSEKEEIKTETIEKVENEVKEETTTEKNPQIGVENIGLTILIVGIVSVIMYAVFKNKKLFVK